MYSVTLGNCLIQLPITEHPLCPVSLLNTLCWLPAYFLLAPNARFHMDSVTNNQVPSAKFLSAFRRAPYHRYFREGAEGTLREEGASSNFQWEGQETVM